METKIKVIWLVQLMLSEACVAFTHYPDLAQQNVEYAHFLCQRYGSDMNTMVNSAIEKASFDKAKQDGTLEF